MRSGVQVAIVASLAIAVLGAAPPGAAEAKQRPADAVQITKCLRSKPTAVRCLRDLSKPRPAKRAIKDCLGEEDRLACLGRLLIAPPKPEELVTSYPALPPSVTLIQFPDFTADGSEILAAAEGTDFAGTQIVAFGLDGSNFRCLTCATWTGAALLKPLAFDDGKRVMLRIGQQNPFTPADHGVLECSPSVAECAQATVVPIAPPAGGDASVLQDQREYRVAPDGKHVGLTQVRSTPGGLAEGIGIVGNLVRSTTEYVLTDPRVVAVGGELKGFTPDGRSVLFARFTGAFDAGNPDDVAIDLKTGRERRLTYAADWDEDIDVGPSDHQRRRWQVVGTARGTGELETLGQIRRPTAIEYGTHALNFSTFGGPESAEPWLVDEYEARGSYLGQPLAPTAIAEGWDSRAVTRWSPLGNRIVFWQKRIDGPETRVVLVTLAARKAKEPKRAPKSPSPRWAESLYGYVPSDPVAPTDLAGRVSGQMTVAVGPSAEPGYQSVIEVRYSNYSDQRGFVLNGTERADFNPPTQYGGESLYSADVNVSGKHSGYLRATRVVLGQGDPQGVIESELDGHRLTLGVAP